MRQDIAERVLSAARYMLKNSATVRDAARSLGVSKTTVHKDMRARLPQIDGKLAESIDALLGFNLSERHLRGGEATRRKYRQE